MKNLVLFLPLALLLLHGPGALAQKLPAKARVAILEVMKQQELAWNRGDIPAFMEGYARQDSLRFVSKNGVNYGWEPVLQRYQRAYPDAASMGKLRFTILSLEKTGRHSAFMLGQWQLQRQEGGKEDIGGYFTLLWRRIGGAWRIVCDHTS